MAMRTGFITSRLIGGFLKVGLMQVGSCVHLPILIEGTEG